MPFINDVIAENREKCEDHGTKSRMLRQSRFTFEPDHVLKTLQENIVGQDHILSTLYDLLHCVKADIGDTQRPLAVCFLAGSTGVGKTQTAKLLASCLTGRSDGLCRIDMATLAQDHYSAAITGAPPGYSGSKEELTLLDADKIQGSFSKPGVVLFDEVEKASTSVKRALLNIMDTGQLRLASGKKTIDFTNAILLFTSNAGVREVQSYEVYRQAYNKANLKQCIKSLLLQFRRKAILNKRETIFKTAIKKHFDPEFLNRIDYLLIYHSLNESILPQLLDVCLAQLNQRLANKSVRLSLDQKTKAYLLKNYNTEYGARDLIRQIRQVLEPSLAKAMNTSPDVMNFSSTFSSTHEQGVIEIHPEKA